MSSNLIDSLGTRTARENRGGFVTKRLVLDQRYFDVNKWEYDEVFFSLKRAIRAEFQCVFLAVLSHSDRQNKTGSHHFRCDKACRLGQCEHSPRKEKELKQGSEPTNLSSVPE